jgi:hypothetical protein
MTLFLLWTKLYKLELWKTKAYGTAVCIALHCYLVYLHIVVTSIAFTFLICYLSIAAADILLWRDDKRTFSYITVLFLLLYWFLLSDRTFIASAAKILLVTSLALFIHGVLPPQVYVLCL